MHTYIDKPRDDSKKIRGKTHCVSTGMALNEGAFQTRIELSIVRMT